MSAKRFPPDDPREWLRRAKSNLQLARTQAEDVCLEELCYNAQQAAEKAIKAILIRCEIEFPPTHNLSRLFLLAEKQGIEIPNSVKNADALTRYAFEARYPGVAHEVTSEEHQEAIRLAEAVFNWAAARI